MATKKRGRGRLSNIKMLPVEAGEAVQWAAQELRNEKRTQIEIHNEFNEKLAFLGIDPISASSFNRYSIRMADAIRRSNQHKELTSVLIEKRKPGDSDDATIMLAEMLKTLVGELVYEKGEAGSTPKEAMEMSSALRSLVAAEKMSADHRSKLEAKIDAKVEETIDLVSKEAGLSKPQIEQLKVNFLNIPGSK